MSEYALGYKAFELDPEEFAFKTGKQFRGFTITPKDGLWNVIFRAYDRDGHAVYAMGTYDNPAVGSAVLLHALSAKGGESLWRSDKFYSRR